MVYRSYKEKKAETDCPGSFCIKINPQNSFVKNIPRIKLIILFVMFDNFGIDRKVNILGDIGTMF